VHDEFGLIEADYVDVSKWRLAQLV
jgi:hypothetical protein